MALKDITGPLATAQNEKWDEIYGGATVKQLAVLFHKGEQFVKQQITECKPVARRSGRYVYALDQVAPYLCRPKNAREIANFMRTARPNDMPSVLTKEFWNGQRARQAFLAGEGDLWPTDKIVELLSVVFSKIRMDLLLLPDQLDRTYSLTDEQVSVVRNTVDRVLATAAESLVKQFNPDDGEFAVPPGAYHDKSELEKIVRDVSSDSESIAVGRDDADDILFGLDSDDDDDPFEGL